MLLHIKREVRWLLRELFIQVMEFIYTTIAILHFVYLTAFVCPIWNVNVYICIHFYNWLKIFRIKYFFPGRPFFTWPVNLMKFIEISLQKSILVRVWFLTGKNVTCKWKYIINSNDGLRFYQIIPIVRHLYFR